MAAADLEYRCFVGGLAWTTDDRSLADAFRYFGEVVDSKVINDRETGRSRGFGFVTFSDEQAMTDAIESMNGKELDGRNITVNQAQTRLGGGDGGYRGSNGGGGSRYGDRGSYGSRERSDGGNGGYGGSGRAGGYNDANGGGNGGYGGSNHSGGYSGSNNRYSSSRSDSQNWRK